MKYVDTKVVLLEVPDEISLAINISNCPCHCKGCHSEYLSEDIGSKLNYGSLTELVFSEEGITCVALMGGDSEPDRINKLAKWVKDELDLKVAWYSGRDTIDNSIQLSNFDYIKIGHYDENLGPLNKSTTNQRMYKYDRFHSGTTIGKGWIDITNLFWKDEN